MEVRKIAYMSENVHSFAGRTYTAKSNIEFWKDEDGQCHTTFYETTHWSDGEVRYTPFTFKDIIEQEDSWEARFTSMTTQNVYRHDLECMKDTPATLKELKAL